MKFWFHFLLLLSVGLGFIKAAEPTEMDHQLTEPDTMTISVARGKRGKEMLRIVQFDWNLFVSKI
jgi:hypothetical protein